MICGDDGMYCGECYECRVVDRAERREVERWESALRDLATRPPDGEYDDRDRLVACPYGDSHWEKACGDCVSDAIDIIEKGARA